jgi:hypothetical protein
MLQELLMQPTRWQELWEHPEMVVSPNGTIQVGQGYCSKTVSNSVAFTNNMHCQFKSNTKELLKQKK